MSPFPFKQGSQDAEKSAHVLVQFVRSLQYLTAVVVMMVVVIVNVLLSSFPIPVTVALVLVVLVLVVVGAVLVTDVKQDEA